MPVVRQGQLQLSRSPLSRIKLTLKNLGLYGERAGTFSMVCSSTEEKTRVLSQVKRVIRPLYSSPPMQYVHSRHAEGLVLDKADEVAALSWSPPFSALRSYTNFGMSDIYLSDLSPSPRLTSRLSEVKMMAERIIKMRDVLYDALVKLDTPGDWGHIKSQIGMFSFTGSELPLPCHRSGL